MFECEIFGINGVIETPAGVTEDEFNDKLFAFLEEQGWKFGGGTWRYAEEEDE